MQILLFILLGILIILGITSIILTSEDKVREVNKVKDLVYTEKEENGRYFARICEEGYWAVFSIILLICATQIKLI